MWAKAAVYLNPDRKTEVFQRQPPGLGTRMAGIALHQPGCPAGGRRLRIEHSYARRRTPDFTRSRALAHARRAKTFGRSLRLQEFPPAPGGDHRGVARRP